MIHKRSLEAGHSFWWITEKLSFQNVFDLTLQHLKYSVITAPSYFMKVIGVEVAVGGDGTSRRFPGKRMSVSVPGNGSGGWWFGDHGYVEKGKLRHIFLK